MGKCGTVTMNMKSDADQLDQRMLELVYELIADDEAAELRERIETDPAAAAAFMRAQQMAQVFSAAAKWQEDPMAPAMLHAAVARSGARGVPTGNGEWR